MKWVIILLYVQIEGITSKSIENAVLCNDTTNEANKLEIMRVIDENDQIVPYNGNFKVFKIIGDIVNGNNKIGTKHEDTDAGSKESKGVVLLVNCNNYNDRKHPEVNEFYDLCLNNDYATEPKKLEVKIDGKAEKHLIKLFPIIHNATNLITTPLLSKKLGNTNQIRETRKGFDNKAQIFIVHDDLQPSPLHISKIDPSYIRTIKNNNKNNANINNNTGTNVVAQREANKNINKEKVEDTADISNIREVREKLLDHLLDYFINILKHDTENNNLKNIYQIEEKLKNYYDPQHIETVFNKYELESNTNDLDNNSQTLDQKYIPDKAISMSENHREPVHIIPNQTANEKGYNDAIKNKDVSETEIREINVSNHILPVTAKLDSKLGKYSRDDTSIVPSQVHKDEIQVHEYLNKLPIQPEIESQHKINDTNMVNKEPLHKVDNLNHEFPLVEINDTAEPHLKLNNDEDVHSFPYKDIFVGKFNLKPENIQIYKESNKTNTKPVEDAINLNNTHMKEDTLKLNTNNSNSAKNKTIDGNVFYFNDILPNKVLETYFDDNGFGNTKTIGIKNPNITIEDLFLLNNFANMNKTNDNDAFDLDNVSNDFIDKYLENDVSHRPDATVINQPHKKLLNHRKGNKKDQNLNSASKNKTLPSIVTNNKIATIGMGNDSDENGSKKRITTYNGNNISSGNIHTEEEVNDLTVTVNLTANIYKNSGIYSFLMNMQNRGKTLDEINGNSSKFEKHNETMQVCNNKPLVLHFNINIQ